MLLREIPNSRANFRDDTNLHRFNGVFIFSIAPLVRIILGQPDGLDKLIEPLSRVRLHHRSI